MAELIPRLKSTQPKSTNDIGGNLDRELIAKICKTSQSVPPFQAQVLYGHNIQYKLRTQGTLGRFLCQLLLGAHDVNYIGLQMTFQVAGRALYNKPVVDHKHSEEEEEEEDSVDNNDDEVWLQILNPGQK
ncbi:hypothetical protein PoB_003734600 [Plakobranchus ocellatus]|uniref:Uncharacterized protein n=1 Tax=Plakobranchus ocellatus TaxID=259542 RepID=A0AAV4AI38_9GAST|nr:hypothetical protein PoB_003734600 [Plakobranchus ocellatus]